MIRYFQWEFTVRITAIVNLNKNHRTNTETQPFPFNAWHTLNSNTFLFPKTSQPSRFSNKNTSANRIPCSSSKISHYFEWIFAALKMWNIFSTFILQLSNSPPISSCQKFYSKYTECQTRFVVRLFVEMELFRFANGSTHLPYARCQKAYTLTLCVPLTIEWAFFPHSIVVFSSGICAVDVDIVVLLFFLVRLICCLCSSKLLNIIACIRYWGENVR